MSDQEITNSQTRQITKNQEFAFKILITYAFGFLHDQHFMRNIAVASAAQALLVDKAEGQRKQANTSETQDAMPSPHSQFIDFKTIEDAAILVEEWHDQGQRYQDIALTGISYTEDLYPTDGTPWKRSFSSGAQAAERYFSEGESCDVDIEVTKITLTNYNCRTSQRYRPQSLEGIFTEHDKYF